MAIAEALHAGATTADVSFDGVGFTGLPGQDLHNDRIWHHAIDATTGKIVGGEAAPPEAVDAGTAALAALKRSGTAWRMPFASEQAAAGRPSAAA
jgi:hypothetical protein